METEELFKKYGFKDLDKMEFTRGQNPVKVPFPKPSKTLKIVYQSYQQSIEEIYFWILTHMREDWGFHQVEKIKDIFTASEQSAFWGAAQQRLQIQQNQVSQYMATIGNMVKGLFQIVREIRLLKEKLQAYKEADAGDQAAEVMLKGYWVDLKDGGAKNPGSVYGLATEVGFAILPDLFFSAPTMKNSAEVDKHVKRLSEEFNRKVCEVLGRKLKAYMLWRENTYKELVSREKFTIKYLRQHYDTIAMYMSWVKPYLNNIKRMQMNQQKSQSVDLIGAFEGAITEIEIMCHRETTKTHNGVILATLEYRSAPQMEFKTADYQHKGPIHVGRVEITFRTYGWTPEQINNYKRMREEEGLELLSSIDESVKEAMHGLGDDLKDYLKEAGEKFPEDLKKEEEKKKKEEQEKKELKKKQSAAEPFIEIFSGFKEIFGAFAPSQPMFKSSGEAMEEYKKGKNVKGAEKDAEFVLWQTYKNFKKSHGMLSW